MSSCNGYKGLGNNLEFKGGYFDNFYLGVLRQLADRAIRYNLFIVLRLRSVLQKGFHYYP